MQGWALLVLLAATDAIDAANETVTTAPTGEVETRLPPGERSLEEEGRAAGERETERRLNGVWTATE